MTTTNHEPNQPEDTGTEGQRRSNKPTQIWNKYVVGKEAAWTALFTAALVLFTGLLWRVSNRQNEIAVSSQRAFLTFNGPNVGARLIDNSGTWTGNEIALVWTNGGNTAARNVVIQNNAEAFFPDLPENYSFPLVAPRTKVVIGPKSTYGVNIQMGRDLMSDYWQHKKRLFIWGSAVYSDTFGDTPDRLGEFCIELTHLTINPVQGAASPAQVDISKTDVVLTSFQWQQCPAHNCYDGDCTDYSTIIKQMRE